MRAILVPAGLGAGLTILLVLAVILAGRELAPPPSIPWVCDDTRFVATVPAGRGVVGPAVSASPGCGGQGS
ncbi:MAG: hypothetical protein U0893_01820 [Chloroflexota bacterium]